MKLISDSDSRSRKENIILALLDYECSVKYNLPKYIQLKKIPYLCCCET